MRSKPFFAFMRKSPAFMPGCEQGVIVQLVCLSVCQFVCLVSVCVTFVVFTDCESCMKPISTIPGSMEAGEYGLTCGTCFVASRLEVVAVACLLWISWCVFGGVVFLLFLFFPIFFFERTRPTASMRPPYLIYISASNEARPRERSGRGHFCL